MFKSTTGVNIVHVPYKGTVLALGEVMSGQIQQFSAFIRTEAANFSKVLREAGATVD